MLALFLAEGPKYIQQDPFIAEDESNIHAFPIKNLCENLNQNGSSCNLVTRLAQVNEVSWLFAYSPASFIWSFPSEAERIQILDRFISKVVCLI